MEIDRDNLMAIRCDDGRVFCDECLPDDWEKDLKPEDLLVQEDLERLAETTLMFCDKCKKQLA